MLRAIGIKLATLALTLLVASLIIFVMLELAPGDVAAFMMGVEADPAALAALRAELGLDDNPALRYGRWLGAMLIGDFGTSYTYRVPVAALIGERLGVSLPLAVSAFLCSTALAIVGARAAVSRPAGAAARVVLALSQIGVAIPNFWLALMLMLVFAVWLGLLPAGGFPGWGAPLGALQALVLPVLALALPQAAILCQLLTSALGEAARAGYMRTARAKGLTRGQALTRHALLNAIVPVLPIMGLQFAYLTAGAIVVESVFYLPGLGRLALQAITQRDLITVKAVVMLLVAFVVLVSFVTDLLAAMIDPRLRTAQR